MQTGGMVSSGQQTAGGLSQMLQQAGGDPEVQKDLASIAQEPGGMELLFTTAAEELMKKQGLPTGKGDKEQKAQQVRLYNLGGSVGYNGGGEVEEEEEADLIEDANEVREAGREDDSVLLHMTPEEFEAIVAMWGKPEINPETGLPEYGFLKKAFKKVKKAVKKVIKSPIFQAVAPIALSVFAPGIGTAIGGWLGASGAAAGMAGNAVIGAGLGAVGGGKKGALMGAIGGATAGGAGGALGKSMGLTGKTAGIVGDALLHGAGSSATGQGFGRGAIMGGLTAAARPTITKALQGVQGMATGEPVTGVEGVTQAPTVGEPGSTLMGPPEPQPGLMDVAKTAQPGLMDLAKKYALPIGAGVMALGALGGKDKYEQGKPPPLPPGFDEPLPQLDFNRQQVGIPGAGRGMAGPDSYYTYGQAGSTQPGEHQFFSPNVVPGSVTQAPTQQAAGMPTGGAGYVWDPVAKNFVPAPQVARRGGLMRYQMGGMIPPDLGGYNERGEFAGQGHVRGEGTGRSDEIPASLSDGEYVIDAETVALLGDGSTDAGARRLDEMRENLRKHKGQNLRRGRHSADAKQPHQYLARGGKVSKVRSMLEAYMDAPLKDVEIHPDPNVSGLFAVRVTHKNYEDPVEFIVDINVADELEGVEEVEFKTWPPKAKFQRGGKVGAVKKLWEIFDRKEKKVIGQPYSNRRRASTRVDKLDNEYGAYRYQVRPVGGFKKAEGGQIRKIAKREVEKHESRKPPHGHGIRKKMQHGGRAEIDETLRAMDQELRRG